MKKPIHVYSFLSAFALVSTTAQAGTLLSEKFSGNAETDLVGTATPDGNHWTGAEGEAVTQEEPATQEEATGDAETTVAPKSCVKQDGSVAGNAFTAYHEFDLKNGQVYTLEAVLSPTNKADNQWFTVGFSVTSKNGDAVPNLDGSTTYGQTVLSGSGYRYGWTGPDTKDMCELHGPGLHTGSVKVVLDTTSATAYTIELFDGEGESIHGPKPIGAPAISQIFIGNSGTGGAFTSVTLSDGAAESEAEPASEPEASTTSEE